MLLKTVTCQHNGLTTRTVPIYQLRWLQVNLAGYSHPLEMCFRNKIWTLLVRHEMNSLRLLQKINLYIQGILFAKFEMNSIA